MFFCIRLVELKMSVVQISYYFVKKLNEKITTYKFYIGLYFCPKN